MLRGGIVAAILAVCVVLGVQLIAAVTSSGSGPRAATFPNSYRGAAGSPGGRANGPATDPSSPAARPTDARPSPPRPVPRPSPRRISGSSVTAVGDSVMVASTPALDHTLPGIYIDAMVGRQFYTGLQVIADLKSRGLLRSVVVVGLGTNGTVTGDEIRQLFAEIGPDRRLVLVNTFEARSWEQEVNSTLAAAARDHRHVVLADWFATIEHRTYLLWSDGIHPQPAGGVVYARMFKAAVEKVGNLPG